ncbi:glycosyltransferase family 4 protein [Erwinia rhapontici]|uniref:glycosyltransferase family 4 protein n=1 Tax=Erwinia rhapontici TaxID=55212 RepID=UPI003B9E25EE
MRELSVLFIGALPPPITGQSVACSALHQDFINKGYKVDVVNLSKESLVSGMTSFGRIIQIGRVLLDVASHLRGKNLVYFTPAESVAGNLKDLIIYALLFFFGKLPVTHIHMHGGAGMREILSDKHPILKTLNHFFLKRLAGVIVLGERLVSIYEPFVDQNKISVVRNFATDESFINYNELKTKKINNGNFSIVYLSNLIKSKGYIDLLNAYLLLDKSRRESIVIHFAGGFEDEEQKKEFSKKIEPLSNIHYHGIVKGDIKRELFATSDIFCLPTYYPYEGQPISILEAYAAGCAVLTTDHSGIYDVFTPGINGMEVKKNDPESIRDAIVTLTEDSSLLRKYSVTNSRVARTKYRLHHHLSNLRRVFE